MDFAAAFATWIRVLTQPGVPVFQQEKSSPNANLTTAAIWIAIASVIAGVIFGIEWGVLSGILATFGGAPRFGVVGGIFWAIISTLIQFAIGVGLMHVVAQALGGQGDLGVFAYLLASFQVPLMIIGVIPCIGIIAAIYGIVLTYFAIQANYGLDSGKSILVILVPIVVAIIILLIGR